MINNDQLRRIHTGIYIMTPPVSVIMPVYNREDYLGAAIESVLAQTYRNFELLIWDDGSSDHSLRIASYYANHDKRVRVVSAEHQGQTRALKAAIAQTTGHYLGWVDSDDLLELTALAETVSILDANPDVGLVYTDHQFIDADNVLRGYGVSCKIPYSKERLLTDFMVFHFRLMRRSVYDQVGGINEWFDRAQDYDLCLRLSEVTKIQHLPKPLYYYRVHSDNVSHQQRVEQIFWAQEAIEQAIQRRGLAERYELELRINANYYLREKKPSSHCCK